MALDHLCTQMAQKRSKVEYKGQDKAITRANRMELRTMEEEVNSVPKGS